MDEVDLILHPLRSELNFPIGDKLDLDFNPLRWRLPMHIFDAIFFAETGILLGDFRESDESNIILKQLQATIQEGYQQKSLQKNPHIVLLDDEFYHKKMRHIVMEWVILWLNHHHFTGLNQSQVLSSFLSNFVKSNTHFKYL
jgi:hypothetical protein